MSRYSLSDVFGISDRVQTASYVDRGGLDHRLRYLLKTDRHIVIHGDSKQGKSWLRRRLLAEADTLQIQCLSSSSPEELLTQALGRLGVRAELKQSRSRSLEGQLQFGLTTEAKAIFARLRGNLAATGKAAGTESTEEAALGQYPANLEWVARVLTAADRRLVIEDFHYLRDEHRRLMAEWMKALGEYGLHLIVVGVWPDTNFLSFYNGDLDGRVEDVELRWRADELDEVLTQGARALNVEMVPQLRSRIVQAAYGNVGLLQRLAERVCQEEAVYETQTSFKVIPLSGAYERATRAVAQTMRVRYMGFVNDLVQRSTTNAYKHILRAMLEFDDRGMLDGVARRDLAARIEENSPGAVRPRDLTSALGRLERAQERGNVQPLVLTYSADSRRLNLADRGLLFFRRFGDPLWPWEQTDSDALF